MPKTNPENGKAKKQPSFTLQERLEFGNLNISEVCELAQRSKAAFYEDVQAGRVTIKKMGRRSVVYGPDAKRYIGCVAA